MGTKPLGHTIGFELSPRELEVLWLYGGEGWAVKQVASHLGISEETTKSYLKRIREKLWRRGVRTAGTKHGLFRVALWECRNRYDCRLMRDELLRELLADGAPERLERDLVGV